MLRGFPPTIETEQRQAGAMKIENRDAGPTRTHYIEPTIAQAAGRRCGLVIGLLSLKRAGSVGHLY